MSQNRLEISPMFWFTGRVLRRLATLKVLLLILGWLITISVVPSPSQTTNQADQVQSSSTNAAPGTTAPLSPTNAVPGTAAESNPQPLPVLTVGDKTFEAVILTGFDGKTAVISHAFGVKNIPVSQLSPDQIEALNRTSRKIKIALPGPPQGAATNQVASASSPAVPNDTPAPRQETHHVAATGAPLMTNASPAAAAVPAENPAAVAEAAASTEAMIQDFRSLGRDGEESGQEEAWTRVKIPGFVRVLAWAGFFMLFIGEVWLIGMAIHQTDSMTWALLIFFFNPVAGFIYWIFHIRAAALPYGIYAAGFLMLTIPMLHYQMGFFDLLM